MREVIGRIGGFLDDFVMPPYYVLTQQRRLEQEIDPRILRQIDQLAQNHLEISEDDTEALRAVAANAKTTQAIDGLNLLLETMASSSSARLKERLRERSIGTRDLASIVHNNEFYSMLEIILKRGCDTGLLLPVMLAECDFDRLPEGIKTLVGQTEISGPVGFDFDIQPWSGTKWICSAFESRMEHSMKELGVLVVNDCMLLKYDGKVSAYCYNTVRDDSGDVLREGSIYVPENRAMIRDLQRAFDRGEPTITLQSGKWALMREYGENKRERVAMTHKVRDYVERLPAELPMSIEGVARKEWRRANFEQNR